MASVFPRVLFPKLVVSYGETGMGGDGVGIVGIGPPWYPGNVVGSVGSYTQKPKR